MSYIFISYSHEDEDKAYAHSLVKELNRQGFEVWIDDSIDYGTQWSDVIEEKLDGCGVLILIMTPHSKGSDWVRNELLWAKQEKKRIFPLLRKGDKGWFSVSSIQYVDVRDGSLPPEDFYDSLARVVPREAATPTKTTKETADSPAETRKDQKIDEIVKGLENLADKVNSEDPYSGKYYCLKVGIGMGYVVYVNAAANDRIYDASLIILYRTGLKSADQETYQAALTFKESEEYLRVHYFPSEWIANLKSLGWQEGVLWHLRQPDRFFGQEKKPEGTEIFMKEWTQDTDLVDIAKFLLETNSLFSIKPSDIAVNLQ
jgi:hypothetical protein